MSKIDKDMIFLAGPETVKSTVLYSQTGEKIEIENRVDPKLWYWTKRCNLLDCIEEIKHYFIILILFILLAAMSPFWIFAILGIIVFGFMLFFYYMPKHRELKEFKNMNPIEDDYEASYSCLGKEFQRICEFFELIDVYILVNYSLKDNSICFKYFDLSGNFCEKEFPTTIVRNKNISYTKVIIYEGYLECIIPYKQEEKTSTTSDATS